MQLESGSGSGASTWVSVSVGPPPAGQCVWSEPKGSGFCPEQNCSLWGERPVTNPRASQLFLLRRDCWAVSAGAGMWSPEGVWLPKCSQRPEWRASPAVRPMSVLAKTGSGWSRFWDELSPAVCLVVVWNVSLEIRPQVWACETFEGEPSTSLPPSLQHPRAPLPRANVGLSLIWWPLPPCPHVLHENGIVIIKRALLNKGKTGEIHF